MMQSYPLSFLLYNLCWLSGTFYHDHVTPTYFLSVCSLYKLTPICTAIKFSKQSSWVLWFCWQLMDASTSASKWHCIWLHLSWISFFFLYAVDAWTISFSPDSRFLASGSHTGKINLFGVESGKKESEMDTRGKFTLSIAYVSDLPNGLLVLARGLAQW